MILCRQAPAKLNLTLRVGPRREDGFHPLESLVALIDFCDTVTVSTHEAREFTAWCSNTNVPTGGQNLAVRAARLLAEHSGHGGGVHLAIDKRIPLGAGMGGGSTNAAATLGLLNELWGLHYRDEKLAELGATLGSDVPVFFHGPLSVMRGRGEAVTPLSQKLDTWALLVLPPFSCSTAEVYAAFDALPAPPTRPEPERLIDGGSGAALMPHLFNDLEAAAEAVQPAMYELSSRLKDVLDGPVRMTGSGAAWFRLYDEELAAKEAAERVRLSLHVPAEVARVRRY